MFTSSFRNWANSWLFLANSVSPYCYASAMNGTDAWVKNVSAIRSTCSSVMATASSGSNCLAFSQSSKSIGSAPSFRSRRMTRSRPINNPAWLTAVSDW